ncbi:MAG: hypothetical protein PsegKO_23710 [Pseudohongiellaceae bacterium]
MRGLILTVALLSSAMSNAQISGQMDERDPIVAASVVLSSALALEQFEEFCRSRHPRTAALVSDARQQWMDQHQALYLKAQMIYEELLSFEQRSSLRARQQAEHERIVAAVSEAPGAESFEFCSAVNTTFQAPDRMLTNREQLVSTLESFAP